MNWTSETIDALWDYSDPAGSEAKFRGAIAEGAGDEARTQVVRALGLQRKFEEAHQELDQVVSGEGAIPARKALERGRLFRSAGDSATALPLFEEAAQLARAAGAEFYEIDALHMLALVQGEEESLKTSLDAMEAARNAKDPRCLNWVGTISNNLGWTHHEAGRFEEALALFREALEVRTVQGQAGRIQIAEYCVAKCLRDLGRVFEALEINRRLVQENPEDGYFHEELAECLLLAESEDSAKPSFARAYELLREDSNVLPDRLERMGRLGGLG